MRVEPYALIRVVTFVLASFWTLRSLWRMARTLDRWERRLVPFGISRSWLRMQLVRMMLRASILDPVNLPLILMLVSVWVV